MSYVIKVVLGKSQHPEYGRMTIPFPIPNNRYNQTIEKLNAIVLMTGASEVESICRLAEKLELFDFIPGIQTPEEYGRYMI